MDKVDEKILDVLIKNPTEPFFKIAKKVDLAPSTVKIRYEKMKNKVFRSPFIIADFSKIGYRGKAMLMITNSNQGNHAITLTKLQNIPDVFVVAETIGKFDIIAFAAFRDIKEIKKIVNELRTLASIKKVEVALTDQTDFPLDREYKKHI